MIKNSLQTKIEGNFLKLINCNSVVLSHVWLFVSPWTVSRQTPLSMEFSWPRILEWDAISHCRGSSQPRDWIWVSCISCIGREILYSYATWKAKLIKKIYKKSVADVIEKGEKQSFLSKIRKKARMSSFMILCNIFL